MNGLEVMWWHIIYNGTEVQTLTGKIQNLCLASNHFSAA